MGPHWKQRDQRLTAAARRLTLSTDFENRAHRDRPWILEGDLLEGGRQCRQRLRIDPVSGTIIERGDLAGEPDVTWPEGCLVLPGFVDIHVHCRDDSGGSQHHKEDFHSASLAAIHGGVVLVGDMPNNPDPPDDEAGFMRKQALVRERALVDVVIYGGVVAGSRPFRDDIPYKCYFGPSVGDINARGSRSVEELLAPYSGHLVVFHAEDPETLRRCSGARTHEQRRPPEAEAIAIERILELARELGFQPHIAHLSTEIGLEEIRKARRQGVAVSCEVAPHHLTFDDGNRGSFSRGDWLQMNPPLRSRKDREALIEGLIGGEIEILATDHAPHTIEENEAGISGVPLLDTHGAFLCRLAADGIGWETLVERASRAPAALFRSFTDGTFGDLQPGSVASLAIVDPRREWRVRAEEIRSRAGWSPFEGVALPGQVIATIVRGRCYQPTETIA